MLNRNNLRRYVNLTTILWIAYVFALVLAAKQLCDRYCFDAFVYRRNNFLATLYGYKEKERNLCMAQLNSDGFRERQLSPKKEGEYLILAVGDSVVYGQGLLKSQRFSEILEKQLSEIRPTRILNLGTCGTNIYQHYLTVEKFKETLHPDLVVVGFTENDLLIWEGQLNYPPSIKDRDNIVYDIKAGEESEYKGRVLGSFDETTANIKMLDYVVPLFPKQKTLFLSFNYLRKSEEFQDKLARFYSILEKNNLKIIDSTKLYKDKYRTISLEKGEKESLQISDKELHPNSLANQMFAESLFWEITTNKSLGF